MLSSCVCVSESVRTGLSRCDIRIFIYSVLLHVQCRIVTCIRSTIGKLLHSVRPSDTGVCKTTAINSTTIYTNPHRRVRCFTCWITGSDRLQHYSVYFQVNNIRRYNWILHRAQKANQLDENNKRTHTHTHTHSWHSVCCGSACRARRPRPLTKVNAQHGRTVESGCSKDPQ